MTIFNKLPTNDNPSLFIALEGIEGCGKSSQMTLLYDFIFNMSKIYSDILMTREPTYSFYGQKARKLLANDADPVSHREECINAYVKDRFDHQYIIEEALKRPAGVAVTDRYILSTVAYQSAQVAQEYAIDHKRSMSKQLRLKEFEKLIAKHKQYNILFPDLTLLFDLPVDVAKKRVTKDSSRTIKEKFDGSNFQKIVRNNYRQMSHYHSSIRIIDASLPQKEVFEQLVYTIVPVLYSKCPEYLIEKLEEDLTKNYLIDLLPEH